MNTNKAIVLAALPKRAYGWALLPLLLLASWRLCATETSMAPAHEVIITPAYTEHWMNMSAPKASLANKPEFAAALELPEKKTTGAVPAEGYVPAFQTTTAAAAASSGPTLDQQFAGIWLSDLWEAGMSSPVIPPDTMGAVGPNHFVEIINATVAIFDKEGNWLSHHWLEDLFGFVDANGRQYPRTRLMDPRIMYDRRSGRWMASALEAWDATAASPNHVLLAVSATDDPAGVWSRYLVRLGQTSGTATYRTDFDTLGTDGNGIYVAASIFGPTNTFMRIAAIPKQALLSGAAVQAFYFSDITGMYGTPQPACNFDNIASTAPAWFVASWPFGYRATDLHGNLTYRRLVWKSGEPYLDTTTGMLTTSTYAPVINAPALGGASIHSGDDRLTMALIRNGRLWTCRNVGVDVTGNPSCGTCADRNACEWLQLNVSGTNISLGQLGRVFDTSSSNPRSYYYPSLVVNGQGHTVMGFSGSSATEYVGAYYTWRLASDQANTMRTVRLLKGGEAAYERLDSRGRNRWGDYSATSLDPSDDMTFWTIQEYAGVPYEDWGNNVYISDNWATWIGSVRAPAPVLNALVAKIPQGAINMTLNLTGKGFYDPGANFPQRLRVEISGSSEDIVNLQVKYVNSTNVRVTFDVALEAVPGSRDIVLVNPDEQRTTISGAFTIIPRLDLALSPLEGPASAVVACQGAYIVIVTNLGPLDAPAVKLIHTFPSNYCVVSSDAPLGFKKRGNNTITNYLGDMASGQTVTVTTWAIPSRPGPMTNTVCVTSDAFDYNPANNQAMLMTTVSTNPAGPGPTLVVDDVKLFEGNSGLFNANFRVSLLPGNSRTVTVYYATMDGTAAAGQDFVPTNGALLFLPGETIKTITVKVKGDVQTEPDEMFYVRLAPNAMVLNGKLEGAGTIWNDDAGGGLLPEANLSISLDGPASPITFGSVMTYTIRVTNLGPNDASGVSVCDLLPWTVKYGSASPKPVSVKNNVATFSLGSLRAGAGTNISLRVTNTALGLNLNLVRVTSANPDPDLGDNTASHEAQALPVVSVVASDGSATEGTTNSGAFTFKRTGSTSAPLLVFYGLGGTADSADYASLPGSVLIPKGASSCTVVVRPTNDVAVEMTETVMATVLPGPDYLVHTNANAVSVNILDNDLPSISVDDTAVYEVKIGDNAIFTIRLSAATSRTVSVRYATANGTALAGSDYVAKSGVLTFAPGITNQTVAVGILGDQILETNETFFLKLSSPSNATLAVSSATGIILGLEIPPKVNSTWLRISSARLEGDEILLQFEAQQGQVYLIQRNDNASLTGWVEVSSFRASASGTLEIRQARGSNIGRGFFRVVQARTR